MAFVGTIFIFFMKLSKKKKKKKLMGRFLCRKNSNQNQLTQVYFQKIMAFEETIFIFFMKISKKKKNNGTISMQNKFHSKSTNSSLFATNMFL